MVLFVEFFIDKYDLTNASTKGKEDLNEDGYQSCELRQCEMLLRHGIACIQPLQRSVNATTHFRRLFLLLVAAENAIIGTRPRVQDPEMNSASSSSTSPILRLCEVFQLCSFFVCHDLIFFNQWSALGRQARARGLLSE